MKEQLDEFIRKNRAGFDNKEPGEKVWKNIEASLKFNSGGLWNSVSLWRAAAVIFMVLSTYLLIPKQIFKSENADQTAADFRDVEAFYFQEISDKVELIEGFQKNDGLNGFTQDFKQLEAMYMILKEEMRSRPTQKVKDALVLNLLVRINLLNQQLYKLEKSDNDTKKIDKEV